MRDRDPPSGQSYPQSTGDLTLLFRFNPRDIDFRETMAMETSSEPAVTH